MLLVIDFVTRFWTDMIERADGPMTFRFFLQPTMALITALIDGIKDARAGRQPYAWLLTHSAFDARLLAWRGGVTSTARILLLGVAMDVIYQFRVFGRFEYPLESFVIAVVLGFLPYLLLRGPINRTCRWWMRRRSAHTKDRTP